MDKNNQKNNFNNPIVIVLVLALLGLGGYVLFSKNSDNSNQNQATTPTQVENQISPSPAVQNQQQVQTPTPQPSYTAPRYYAPMTFSSAVEAQRSAYVNGCTSSGGMWGKCNCGFDYLISNYGLVWLINEEAYININGVASSQLRSASSDSVKYCSVYSN